MVTNPGKPAVDQGHRDTVAAGLERLCEWAVAARSAPLPDGIRRRASLVVSDDIAAMVVAASEPQVSAAQERILSPGGNAEATVFGASRQKAPRSLAAAANGLALPWAELDEGYRPLPCHAGGYTLPALLAEAEAENATIHDMLRALCISYEITTRIAHTFPFDNLTIHPHGAFNSIGAAAGIAVLRGYDAKLLRDTLTSAATMVCAGPFNHAIEGALARNTWTGLGSIAGFQAADFAPLGITGLAGALYDVYATGFSCRVEPKEMDQGLGKTEWAIERGYHKIYACCQYLHSAVQASMELAGRLSASSRPIKSIEVETHARGLALTGPAPETVLAAKFSMPHALATVAVLRTAGAKGFDSASLGNTEIAAMRERVTARPHPAIGDWPNDRPARVHWTFDDGTRWTAVCENARGGADQPYSERELLAKFEELTSPSLPKAPEALRSFVADASATDRMSWRDMVNRVVA